MQRNRLQFSLLILLITVLLLVFHHLWRLSDQTTVHSSNGKNAASLLYTGNHSPTSTEHARIADDIELFSPRPSSLASSSNAPYNDIVSTSSSPVEPSELPLPQSYPAPPTEEAWCTERYGPAYLHNLVRSKTAYCDSQVSMSNLTCFHSQTETFDTRIDNFCFASRTGLNKTSMKFNMNCRLKDFSAEDNEINNRVAKGTSERWGHKITADEYQPERLSAPSIEGFGRYWTDTGPAVVIPRYFDFDTEDQVEAEEADASRDFTVVVQREATTKNLWHSLWGPFSLTLTFDVLQMARNPQTGRPFWTPEDMNRTQVLILDEYDEGPNYALWRLMAKKPVLRAQDLPANYSIRGSNIIVPLQDSANPLWQGDWKAHDCVKSELTTTFVQRVLDFYDLKAPEGSGEQPLVVTYLNRTGSRQLRDFGGMVERLQGKYPLVEMQLIELEDMAHREQLQIIRKTDILVGVHGAGLTHTLFLPPSATVAEIRPPNVDYWGFRNLAKIGGHQYFGTHGSLDTEKSVAGNWHFDHVSISEERFQSLMETAIKSQYNRNIRTWDVT